MARELQKVMKSKRERDVTNENKLKGNQDNSDHKIL